MNKLKALYTKYKNHIVIGVNLLFMFTIFVNLYDLVFYGIQLTTIQIWLYSIMLLLFGVINILENYINMKSKELEMSYEELQECIEELESEIYELSKQVDKYNSKVEYKELKEADEIIEFMNRVKP